MKQKSVLLLGSYGQSNLGDDLLMWNYLGLLHRGGFKEIYVNANTKEFLPDPVKKTYPDLHVINTYQTSLLDYIRLIRKVDVIVYGGGTLYKELYASTGRSKYSVIVRMMGFNVIARIFGTRLYHLHIGIGSLKTKTGRLIAKIALQSATKTIFRDQKSYDVAKDVLHVPRQRIEKSTDGLFIDHIWERPWREADLKIDRKKYKKVIGINMLSDIPDWIDRDQYIAVMQRSITRLLDEGNYIVFFPFQHAFNPHHDLLFMEETLKETLRNRSGYRMLKEVPIDLVSSYLQQCNVFIGMRFHSLLLATVNRVPFVAIAYDTKCWRFIEEVDYHYALKLEDITVDDLMDVYKQTIKHSNAIKSRLSEISQQTYAEAEEDIRALNL